MSKNPYLEAAKLQRQRDRQAIGLLRSYQDHRSVPLVMCGRELGERLVVLACRILAERCTETGEDPAAVLAAMEADI